MGAVDLVVQVESPGAVSQGLQRIGRAGHQVGEPSRGKLFPKHRPDLLEAAVVVERMVDGPDRGHPLPPQPARRPVPSRSWRWWPSTTGRSTTWPRGPAGGAVRRAVRRRARGRARPAVGPLPVRGVRRAAPPHRVGPGRGRGPGRAGRPAPGRHQPRHDPRPGPLRRLPARRQRVGELDEEMVYESRAGETFLLGATTWRIEDITHDRVIVTPAPGQPGKMPFWHGDGPAARSSWAGRWAPSSRAAGTGRRGAVERLRDGPRARRAGRRQPGRLPRRAGRGHRRRARRPHDRGRALPRRDRRLAGVRPLAVRRPVHAPWAMALKARLAERWGVGRRADLERRRHRPPPARAVDDAGSARRSLDPEDRRIEEVVVSSCPARRCSPAGSASRRPGRCSCPGGGPTSARRCGSSASAPPTCWRWPGATPSFPILLEATRECLNDVFDLPALREVLGDIAAAEVRVVAVETPHASPFAQSLLFGWIAVYMYEGDAPLAERRAAALALDRDLLDDLLGAEELRELLDAGVLADLELELQWLDRRPPGPRRRRGPRPAAAPRPAVARRARTRRTEGDGRRPGSTGWWPSAGPSEGPHRRRRAGGGGRGRRAPARRPRRGRPGGAARRVHRVGRGPAGRPGGALRPHPRAVHHRPGGRPLRRPRPIRGGARCPGRAGPGGAGRVPARRRRARVVRRRGPAPAAPPVPGRAAPRGRAGRRGHAGPVPRRVARASGPPRRGMDALVDVLSPSCRALRCRRRCSRPRSCPPGWPTTGRPTSTPATAGDLVWVGAGAIGSNDGRVRLVFRDQAGLLVPGRPRRTSCPTAGPPGAARAPRPAGRVVLGRPGGGGARGRPALRRRHRARRPVGPGVGGPGDQRLAGPAAGVRGGQGPQGGRPPPSRGGPPDPAGPPAGAGRWSLVGPAARPPPVTDRAGPRPGRPAGRALRGAHPGGGAGRGHRGRLRRGVPGAAGPGGEGAHPPRLLRRRPGGGPVRAAGAVDRLRSGPAGDRGRRPPRAGAAGGRWPPPTRPSPTAPPLPWPQTGGRPGPGAGALVVLADGEPVAFVERGGRSIWTFPAAADRGDWPPLWPAGSSRAASARTRSRRSTATRSAPPRGPTPSASAGYADGYRGLVARARGPATHWRQRRDWRRAVVR